jgi:GNAT superfamily N-acetyltransferase
MLAKEYKVEEISYKRKEDRRILEAVLKTWFKNPKLLNLVSPNLKYPFNFKEWWKIYSRIHTRSIILKVNKWIIGHLSIKQDLESNRIDLFHLVIDPKHIRQGYGSKLILKAEEIGQCLNVNLVALNVLKSNENALKLYHNLGYEINLNKSNKKNFRCEKINY